MPSIPQSLLWISLVVLWLFVLVPMLINKRDNVRRTSDVALATRVLNSGRNARLLKRVRPAAGHRSDPDWRPEEEFDAELAEDETGPVVVTSKVRVRSVAVVTSLAEEDEPDILDVDVVEDPVAEPAEPVAQAPVEPVSAHAFEASEPETDELKLEFDEEPPAPEPVPEPVSADATATATDAGGGADIAGDTDGAEDAQDVADDEDEAGEEPRAQDGTADEYEYVEDTSGLEAEADPATTRARGAARSRRYETKTAAAVSARKYRFRKRMISAMASLLVFFTAAAFLLTSAAWYLVGAVGAVTVLYLAYLRRQTRIEEQLRRRRMQRMARSRLGVENAYDRDLDVVPSRLRQPGAAVLEIDDEDPMFEHLDEVPFARHYDLPHAAGQ